MLDVLVCAAATLLHRRVRQIKHESEACARLVIDAVRNHSALIVRSDRGGQCIGFGVGRGDLVVEVGWDVMCMSPENRMPRSRRGLSGAGNIALDVQRVCVTLL